MLRRPSSCVPYMGLAGLTILCIRCAFWVERDSSISHLGVVPYISKFLLLTVFILRITENSFKISAKVICPILKFQNFTKSLMIEFHTLSQPSGWVAVPCTPNTVHSRRNTKAPLVSLEKENHINRLHLFMKSSQRFKFQLIGIALHLIKTC